MDGATKTKAIRKNEEELAKLAGPFAEFSAVDVAVAPYLNKEKRATALLNATSGLLQRVRLDVGALVVGPIKCFSYKGVSSGSRGEMVGLFSSAGREYLLASFMLRSGTSTLVQVVPRTDRCTPWPHPRRMKINFEVEAVGLRNGHERCQRQRWWGRSPLGIYWISTRNSRKSLRYLRGYIG